jgi:hypothetical protein
MKSTNEILNEITTKGQILTFFYNVGPNATKEQNYFADNNKLFLAETVYDNQFKEDLKKPILKPISKTKLFKIIDEKSKKEFIDFTEYFDLEYLKERIEDYENELMLL